MKTDFPVVLKYNDEKAPAAKIIYKKEYREMKDTDKLCLIVSMQELLEKERQRLLTLVYGENCGNN